MPRTNTLEEERELRKELGFEERKPEFISSGDWEWDEENCNFIDPAPLVVHRSFTYYRTRTSWREKMIADLWEAENKKGLLDKLLGQSGIQATQFNASLVAEMFQWLGTNCGRVFLAKIMQIEDCESSAPISQPQRYTMIPNEVARLQVKQYKLWCEFQGSGLSIEELTTSSDPTQRRLGKEVGEACLLPYWPELQPKPQTPRELF